MMKVTYFGSRRFESQPLVDALNESDIPAELVLLTGGKIEKLKMVLGSLSPFVVVDAPYLPSIILAFMKKAGLFRGRYVIRLRGDPYVEMQSFRTPFLRTITSASINSAFSVMPVAKYLEDKLKKIHPKTSVYTIYNGVDTDLFSPARRKKKNSDKIEIVTVMNFSIPKKLEHMSQLPSVIDSLSKMYDVNFSFAGGGKYLNQIKGQFPGCATFLGQLSRQDILELLSSTDIFLYPTSLDVLPNAVLEASSMGIPVVSTYVGGIPEIVNEGETGFLFKDAGECKSLLQRLIEDEKLRLRMGKAGRKRMMERFSWAKTTEKFVGYIRNAAGES